MITSLAYGNVSLFFLSAFFHPGFELDRNKRDQTLSRSSGITRPAVSQPCVAHPEREARTGLRADTCRETAFRKEEWGSEWELEEEKREIPV